MTEANLNFDDAQAPGSRKNSILVKDEGSSSKANLQSAHPHFVERIIPHRSPPGSGVGTPEFNPNVGQVLSQGSNGGQQQYLAPKQQPQATQVSLPQQHRAASPGPSGPSGPSVPQDRLSQLQLGGNHAAPSSGTQSPVSDNGSNVNLPGAFGGAPVVPSGALLAQYQADAQNAAPMQSGPAWARQHPHLLQGLNGSPSTGSLVQPSRVGSPLGVGSDAEGPVSGRATSKQPSDPRIPMDDGKVHILIGVTGSLHVSSVKSIITKLQSIYGERVAIQVIITPAAEKLIASSGKEAKEAKEARESKEAKEAKELKESKDARDPKDPKDPSTHVEKQEAPTAPRPETKMEQLHSLAHPNLKDPHPNIRVWHDADEWETWRSRNDPVIHIELRRWADILIIAPMSANTLGKVAMGLCDNLLTNVVRAWNTQYPILVAPAMVAYAYNHPATKHHLNTIREEMKWIEILRPTEKVAGSTGGIGMGGMMPWNEIVDRIVHKLGGYPDDEDEDDEDEDEDDDALRGHGPRRGAAGVDEDDDDDDEEDDDDEDILKEGIEESHPPSPHGSPI